MKLIIYDSKISKSQLFNYYSLMKSNIYIYIYSEFKNNSLKGIQIIHIFENFWEGRYKKLKLIT